MPGERPRRLRLCLDPRQPRHPPAEASDRRPVGDPERGTGYRNVTRSGIVAVGVGCPSRRQDLQRGMDRRGRANPSWILPFRGMASIFHGNTSLFLGNVPLSHGFTPIFHGKVAPFLGLVWPFHGIVSSFHGKTAPFHGTAPSEAPLDSVRAGLFARDTRLGAPKAHCPPAGAHHRPFRVGLCGSDPSRQGRTAGVLAAEARGARGRGKRPGGAEGEDPLCGQAWATCRTACVAARSASIPRAARGHPRY